MLWSLRSKSFKNLFQNLSSICWICEICRISAPTGALLLLLGSVEFYLLSTEYWSFRSRFARNLSNLSNHSILSSLCHFERFSYRFCEILRPTGRPMQEDRVVTLSHFQASPPLSVQPSGVLLPELQPWDVLPPPEPPLHASPPSLL